MILVLSILFQSTLPREERRSFVSVGETLLNFNPRSHERSDFIGWSRNGASFISIHAPTRGATRIDKINEQHKNISIHAPTRGATSALFNNGIVTIEISIHAPTRGATCRWLLEHVCSFQFQSTLPREERQQYCTKNLFIFIQYRQ